ncbi:globoside alpha-1%2C3-N-acetylgalactosaminyltransferase 1-like isoform X2 [Xyrichtys novacula]|uniref:Globoside alpha-1,3-N-acetylgalactosaminyltransferase 1-like isoform X2 n=1 Tax=Xyrichtys novacula TaxID=13765 RepID=A0AAV1EJQ5_XYRNO|nr:globoside alpha-1%2C3-N-acetylgalactosaminyltransferase 1-like isoform X2 [Xyrichtys novacula]
MGYISRNHILIILIILLALLGVMYISLKDNISYFRYVFCPTDAPLTNDELIKQHCPEDKSRRFGDLKMQPGLHYAQPSTQRGRTDVNSVTNWNAPLVWEGTFDRVLIDAIYKQQDPRVAVIVLAVGKYTRFLKKFLESGEKFFLVNLKVTYYIFTDNEQDVPKIELAEGRRISILPVPSAKRWQEVVLSRMKWATVTIEQKLRDEADYLFMMDVDSVFHNTFGSESLSKLSAVLHRGYYKNVPRKQFPYERRPESKAYIPIDEGDYYYTAAVWGGYIEDMYKLVKHCYEQSEEDAKNGIEAAWQEESHLNRYLLYNKPTKVLSPEYLWSDYDAVQPDIKVVRVSQIVKNYSEVRPNKGH